MLDHRNPPSSAADAVAAATLNIDEILELCADYERQIDEEKVIPLPSNFRSLRGCVKLSESHPDTRILVSANLATCCN